jgi:hypothetical protein
VSPVFGITGTAAYNDSALVTSTFAVFYLLQLWDNENNDNLLYLISLLSGFCFALKYTGGLAFLFALGWVFLRKRRIAWHALLVPAALVALPWMLRNWFWIGNPFAPFLNRWFPNPYFSAAAEKAYLADVGHFDGLRHWWDLPLQITLYGHKIPGFLGPVFLLAPFALLALHHKQGRKLLTAAAVFSLPFAFNAATRFLMAGVPFLALAMGLAMRNSRGVLALLALFQALLCWPAFTPLYAAPWSWRISTVPIRAALGLEPESAFIERHFPAYALKPILEQRVSKSQRIFSFATRTEAYFACTIVVGYESAEGLEMQQRLFDALDHPELRRQATATLKERNIEFLLIDQTDLIAGDLEQHSSQWGVSLLAEAGGTRFYRID